MESHRQKSPGPSKLAVLIYIITVFRHGQKKNDLTEREKGQIKAYYDQGLNFAEIGRKIGRNRTTISKFLRKKYSENGRQNCGRKEKLTERA